jgi:serine/threonine-protein kinase
MGTTRVRHRLLDEIRVIKVMRPNVAADEEFRRRFVDEARTATRLKHPNICAIYDFALDPDGSSSLVMEFIDGVTLADLLKAQRVLDLALALEITHQALMAHLPGGSSTATSPRTT